MRQRLRSTLLAIVLLCVAATPSEGQSRVLRVPSKLLGETRIAHVALPPNYALARQRYPVVLLLDGQVRAFVDLAAAASRYDLVAVSPDPVIPPQIVIAIEQGDRRKDLATDDSLFLRFLVEELLPRVDRDFRTVPFRTLIGHSLGGRFALFANCRAPDAFGAIIAISPGVADSAVAAALRACTRALLSSPSATRARHIVLSVGEREERLVPATRDLATFLADSAPRAWRTHVVSGAGLGHTETPLATIPAGLRAVFMADSWRIPAPAADSLASGTGDPEAVLRGALAAVSAHVGFEVPPSVGWRRTIARVQLARGTPDDAVRAAERMIADYPEETQGHAFHADALLRRLDVAGARRALQRALEVLDRSERLDETSRERQRALLRQSLADLQAR